MNIFGKPRLWITFIVFIMSFNLSFSVDSINIVSPNYFGEQNNIYEKINYLENELLSFEFCSDKSTEEMKFIIVVDSGKDIELKSYENMKKKNCFFSNYDLKKIDSGNFDLEIIYSVDNKEKVIKRKFKKQKQSKLINHVLGLDPEVLNPVDLSHFLIVLNDVESAASEQSQYVYEKLKQDRNNNNKCWPRDNCNIIDTSRVLRNLAIAGYSHSSRLLEDGENYLNKYKISNENNPSRFDILVDNSFVTGEELTCTLKIDEDDEVNYAFDKDQLSITKFASDILNFRCNQTVEEITIKEYSSPGSLKDTNEYKKSVGVNIKVDPFSCIGKDNNCDYSATIDTLIGYGSGITDSNLLVNYINSLVIVNPDDTESLDTNSEFEDTGKYLYYQSNKALTDTLKFSQNNDGGFGDRSIYEDIIKTAWSVLGLQKVASGSEYVDDGKKWIYYNEPDTGWGNVEKNTLAYLAIKEQIKPYIKINSVNEIEKETKFIIENPTIHNLRDIKVTLTSELNPFVSYLESLGDLDGKDTINFNVKVDKDFYSKLTGNIKISGVDGKNNQIILLDIPINLIGPTPISIVSGNYSMTPEVPVINVRFFKNVPDFNIKCEYENPFDGSDEIVTLSSLDSEIPIMNSPLKQGNFDLLFECSYDENTFFAKGNVTIDLAEKSFDTEEVIILTSTDDFSFHINDTTGLRQTLTFDITGHYSGIIVPAETSKLLAINDNRDLFFRVLNPILLEALGNASNGDLIIKSTSGYKKKIPIVIDIKKKAESSGLVWWVWVLVSIVIGFICLIAFRFYEMKIHHGTKDEEVVDDNDDYYFE